MISAPPVDATETNKEISPSRWLIATLGIMALAIVINLVVAWRMDVFGIMRDPRGRKLITSEHERKAKYLLNQAYVPANFDSLIIGASASVNWHPENLTGYRFYNESLEGADASEQRRIVEQALPRGHFKLALVGLYPRVTALHLLQDGFDQVKRSEAFGSITTLGIEFDSLRNRLEHRPAVFYPNGSHVLPVHGAPKIDQNFGKLDFAQDPEAVNDYRSLVQELLDHGVRVIYVSYPLFGSFYNPNKEQMNGYMASVKSSMPAAPIIDFNSPEYEGFRDDPQNYIDEIHLSPRGAEKLTLILNARMHQTLGD